MKRREEMIIGKHNNPAAGRAEQHPCRRILTAAVTVAGPLLLTMPAFAALNCTTQPSCTELGYSKTRETNCESYVSCPFDTSYKACVKYGTATTDCSGYTLSSCPAGAVSCSACGNGTNVKYKVDSCKSGYQLSSNTCVVNSCSGYTLTSCPTGATCDQCVSGTTTKYRKTGCQSSYVADGDICYSCSDMQIKIRNATTKRDYYLYCEADNMCNTSSMNNCSGSNGWYSWFDPCITSLTGVGAGWTTPGKDLIDADVGTDPLNPSANEKVCSRADRTQCEKARDKLQEVLDHHNEICPAYKVTNTNYYFNCTSYGAEPERSNGIVTRPGEGIDDLTPHIRNCINWR